MIRYRCRVSNAQGKITQQTIEAQDKAELQAQLEDRGLYLIECTEERKGGSLKGRQHNAVLELTQSLSLMIASGLSLKDSFEVAQGLFKKGNTALLVEQLAQSIRRGDSFSQAVEARKEYFPPLYSGMIALGQRVGQLDQVLPSLAQWMKESKELRDRVTGAMIYPIIVLTMVFLGIFALLIFFVPFMEEMLTYSGMGDTSGLDQAVASAKGMTWFFGGMGIFIVIQGLFFRNGHRISSSLGEALDRFKLRVPLLGNFLMTRQMQSLSFALSILTKCKVPLEEGLSQATDVLENRFLKARLSEVQRDLLKGDSLSSLMEAQGAFPEVLSRWIAVGERTGRVDQVFQQLKDYYQEALKKKLERINALAEPVVILLLAVIIIVMIFKVILPLLTLYGGIG